MRFWRPKNPVVIDWPPENSGDKGCTIDPKTGEVSGIGGKPTVSRPELPNGQRFCNFDFAYCAGSHWIGADAGLITEANAHGVPSHVVYWENIGVFHTYYADFDTTLVCATCQK